MSSTVRIALFAVIALVSVGVGLWFGAQRPPQEAANPYAHIGGPFTLEAPAGAVSLDDYRGKVVAIYFGYTHCPDICPTSLAALAAAVGQLTPEEQAQVQGVFISVDPERDDPKRSSEYAKAFHPTFQGLSGSADTIAEVAKRYFVIYEKVEMDDSAMGYAVDHSSIVYILDREGTVQALVRHSNSPNEMAEALRTALTG